MDSRDSFTIVVAASGWERRIDELAEVLAAQFGGPSLRFELGLRAGNVEAATVATRQEAVAICDALGLLEVEARVVGHQPEAEGAKRGGVTQVAGWANSGDYPAIGGKKVVESGSRGTILGVGGLSDLPSGGGLDRDERGEADEPSKKPDPVGAREDAELPRKTRMNSGGWASVLGAALADRRVASGGEPAITLDGQEVAPDVGPLDDWGVQKTVMLNQGSARSQLDSKPASEPSAPAPNQSSAPDAGAARSSGAAIPWPVTPSAHSDPARSNEPELPTPAAPTPMAFPEVDVLERAAKSDRRQARGNSPFLRSGGDESDEPVEYNPVSAALWSVFAPGAGQAYNRELQRGVTYALAGVFIVPWILSVIDAWRRAKELNNKRGKRLPPDSNGGTLIAAGFWFAAIVVFLGFRFLLINLDSGGPNLEPPPIGVYQTVDSGTDSGLTQPSDDGSASAMAEAEDTESSRQELERLEELLSLGEAYCDSGRYETCQTYAQQALEIDPDNREAQTLNVEAVTAIALRRPRRADAGKESEESP